MEHIQHGQQAAVLVCKFCQVHIFQLVFLAHNCHPEQLLTGNEPGPYSLLSLAHSDLNNIPLLDFTSDLDEHEQYACVLMITFFPFFLHVGS